MGSVQVFWYLCDGSQLQNHRYLQSVRTVRLLSSGCDIQTLYANPCGGGIPFFRNGETYLHAEADSVAQRIRLPATRTGARDLQPVRVGCYTPFRNVKEQPSFRLSLTP